MEVLEEQVIDHSSDEILLHDTHVFTYFASLSEKLQEIADVCKSSKEAFELCDNMPYESPVSQYLWQKGLELLNSEAILTAKSCKIAQDARILYENTRVSEARTVYYNRWVELSDNEMVKYNLRKMSLCDLNALLVSVPETSRAYDVYSAAKITALERKAKETASLCFCLEKVKGCYLRASNDAIKAIYLTRWKELARLSLVKRINSCETTEDYLNLVEVLPDGSEEKLIVERYWMREYLASKKAEAT